MPFALRTDLRKLDEFSRQMVLLMKNKLKTAEQLAEFKNACQKCMNELISERTVLNSRLRRSPKAEHVDDWKRQRAALTTEITKLRTDLKLAETVVKRSAEIAGKLLR